MVFIELFKHQHEHNRVTTYHNHPKSTDIHTSLALYDVIYSAILILET